MNKGDAVDSRRRQCEEKRPASGGKGLASGVDKAGRSTSDEAFDDWTVLTLGKNSKAVTGQSWPLVEQLAKSALVAAAAGARLQRQHATRLLPR